MDTATDTIHRATDVLSNQKTRSRDALRLRVLTVVVEAFTTRSSRQMRRTTLSTLTTCQGILLTNGELIAVAVQHRGPRGVDHPKMDIELRADRRRAKIAKEFCASASPRVCDNVLRH